MTTGVFTQNNSICAFHPIQFGVYATVLITDTVTEQLDGKESGCRFRSLMSKPQATVARQIPCDDTKKNPSVVNQSHLLWFTSELMNRMQV